MSFLIKRQQRVKIADILSDWLTLRGGRSWLVISLYNWRPPPASHKSMILLILKF